LPFLQQSLKLNGLFGWKIIGVIGHK